MRAVLARRPGMRLLGAAQLISLTGDWVLIVALPYFVFQRTQSSLAAGGIFFFAVLSRLVFGAASGVIVDSMDRQWTMVVAHLLSALSLLGLVAVVHVPGLLWLTYPVVFLEACVSQVAFTARSAFIPSIVDREELTEANTVIATTDSLSRLAGPPLGGVLLAAGGLDVVVLADVASYAVAAAMVACIRVAPRPAAEVVQPAWRARVLGVPAMVKEGVDELLGRGDLRYILVVSAIMMLGLGVFNAQAVPFAGGALGLDSRGVGLLFAAFAASYVMFAPLAPLALKRFPMPTLFVCGLAIKGAALAGAGATRLLPLEFVLFALFGLPDMVLLVAVRSHIQARVDRALLGRTTSSVWTVLNVAMLAGSGVASAAAQRFGPPSVLTATGAATLAVASVLALLAWRAAAAVPSSQRA